MQITRIIYKDGTYTDVEDVTKIENKNGLIECFKKIPVTGIIYAHIANLECVKEVVWLDKVMVAPPPSETKQFVRDIHKFTDLLPGA